MSRFIFDKQCLYQITQVMELLHVDKSVYALIDFNLYKANRVQWFLEKEHLDHSDLDLLKRIYNGWISQYETMIFPRFTLKNDLLLL